MGKENKKGMTVVDYVQRLREILNEDSDKDEKFYNIHILCISATKKKETTAFMGGLIATLISIDLDLKEISEEISETIKRYQNVKL